MKSEGKQYHFLAGFPRSGNTLLSSILNQNTAIHSSHLSPVNEYYWILQQSANNNENAIRNLKEDNTNAILNNLIKNYYSHINKPIIIDREKAWGTEGNLETIKKHITPTPKIIFTVRPVLEILTSFISILPDRSYIDIEMENNNWWYKDYLTKNDNRCDYIMRPWGMIDKSLITINQILKPENKKVFCVIKYDDIVNAPQETMDSIYTFLELPKYKHNFNKIKKAEKDNDEILGQPNMHEIRPQLKKISQDPKEVLSKYIIDKYSNIGWEGLW